MASNTPFDDWEEIFAEMQSHKLSGDGGLSNREYGRKHNANRDRRDNLYTMLCHTFVTRWKWRTTLIEFYKALFLTVLGVVCYFSGKELFRIVQQILAYSNRSGVLHEALQLQTDSVIAIVTAFVSFTSAIIILPTQLAQYLFNKDENMDAVEIIKEMAKWDTGDPNDESEDPEDNSLPDFIIAEKREADAEDTRKLKSTTDMSEALDPASDKPSDK